MKSIVPNVWSYLEEYFGSATGKKEDRKKETVCEEKEDYLHRGERIMNMLKQKGEREFLKISLSELEEEIYSLSFGKRDGFSDIIEILAKKIFRPFLRKAEKADLSAFFHEDSLFRIGIVPYEKDLSFAYRMKSMIGAGFVECTLYEVTVREIEDNFSFQVYGVKEKAHPKRRRNLSFDYEGKCADLAYLFSSLYVFDAAKRAYEKLKTEDEEYLVFLKERASEADMKKMSQNPVSFCYHDYLTYKIRKGGYRPFAIPDPYNIHYSKPYEGKRENFDFLVALFLAEQDRRNGVADRCRYYRELKKAETGGSHAKSYQTKKDIPKNILTAMEQSKFLNWFSYVEYDKETDLEKAAILSEEFGAIYEAYLKNTDAFDNILRFRKLGQHKALGLYYPFVSCLCVDVRSPESFMHEYGHLIDYKKGNLSKRGGAFEPVYKAYETYLLDEMEKNASLKEELSGRGKYNKSYYLQPTEVFARSFELYLSRCKKIHNSLVPVEFSNKYPLSEEYLTLVERYFDELLLHSGKEEVA
ncbi:MAG: hypothetical protein IJN92_00395 [Lachnospiraceae bacterium]|nr:hypothetical protein [Lachnospiraceae bacterium]